MVVDLIVKALMGILNGVLGLIPDFAPSLPALGSVGSMFAGLNAVFPATTLGICLLAILALELFLAVTSLVTWIWQQVPFTFK